MAYEGSRVIQAHITERISTSKTVSIISKLFTIAYHYTSNDNSLLNKNTRVQK